MSLYTVNRYFLKYLIARKIIPLLEVIEYFLKEPVGVKISDDEISTEINYATYSKIKLIHISENKKKTAMMIMKNLFIRKLCFTNKYFPFGSAVFLQRMRQYN